MGYLLWRIIVRNWQKFDFFEANITLTFISDTVLYMAIIGTKVHAFLNDHTKKIKSVVSLYLLKKIALAGLCTNMKNSNAQLRMQDLVSSSNTTPCRNVLG